MPDSEKPKGITLQAVFEKQVAIEALLQQILLKIGSLPVDGIMKDRYAVDKSSPFWDEEKQVYSRQHYLEQFDDKTPKKGA